MFNIQNGIVTLYRTAGIKVERIPTGTYGLAVDPEIGFYLYEKDDMSVPSVTYGDTDNKSDRILKTFTSRRGKNTGVMLEGTKGSGKTLQAKLLSAACQAQGIPTIIIGSAFSGENFINFLTAIKQPVMIMFDEFDKQYPEKEDQAALLTLLDGVGGYDKLYVLTKNDGYVSEFLRNRPSRIFYTFNYKKLPRATMDDFLARNLMNKDFLKDFDTLYELSADLNFDVVQALVEELNRFPEDKFSDVLSIMGITVSDAGARLSKEIVSIKIDGKEYKDIVAAEDLGNMTPSRLFAGSKFDIYLDASKTECDFPSISEWIIRADWDERLGAWRSKCHRVMVHYDEKVVKSMGTSGYVFSGGVEGHTLEIEIVPKEKETYSNFIFGSGTGY